MTTTIVKLNSLADAIGTTAQDHNLLLIARRRLAFLFISRVKIGSIRLKLGSARIHTLEDGNDLMGLALPPNFAGRGAQQDTETQVGKTHTFRFSQELRRYSLDPFEAKVGRHVSKLFDLAQEPAIDFGVLEDLVDRISCFQGVAEIGDA